MKQRYILFVFILIANYTFAQNVVFTDSNFKQLCLKPYWDLDDDGEISLTEALNITAISESTNVGITDLTGIESMPNLTFLAIRNNPISASVDLTSNTELTNLILHGTMSVLNITGLNKLETISLSVPTAVIDVTNKPLLESLSIGSMDSNPLTGVQYLDVTGSPLLKSLWSQETQLTSLDVTQNPLLEELVIAGNNLTTINLTQNPLLRSLTITGNPLGSIDLSSLPLLEDLGVGDTGITSLNLSNNLQLKRLDVSVNTFPNGLDISYLTNLEYFRAYNCNLTNINLTNNHKLTFINVGTNNLNSIDLKNLPLLSSFSGFQNPFTAINFSQNPKLNYVSLTNSPNLEYINLKNGNNNLLTIDKSDLGWLPNLLEVCVDDPNSSIGMNIKSFVENSVNVTSNCTVLSIEDFEEDDNFSLYPNPTNSNIFVNTDNILKSYEIYSQTGQLVGNGTFNENDNAISLQHLANGIYFLKITTDKGTQDAKIIKK